jgi:hypothetical protein
MYGCNVRLVDMKIILGALNLFSACKDTRIRISLLIDWIKGFIKYCTVESTPVFYRYLDDIRKFSFCLDKMSGCSVGDYVALARNFLEFFRPEQIPVAKDPVCDFTSNCIPDFFMGMHFSWRLPLSPPALWIGNMIMRFQNIRDFSALCKYGFFSSMANRRCLGKVIDIIKEDEVLSKRFIVDSNIYFLRVLERALDTSFAVVDLTPPFNPNFDRVEGDGILPMLSGLHVSINPRDVTIYNIERPRHNFLITFIMIGMDASEIPRIS